MADVSGPQWRNIRFLPPLLLRGLNFGEARDIHGSGFPGPVSRSLQHQNRVVFPPEPHLKIVGEACRPAIVQSSGHADVVAVSFSPELR